MIRARYTLIDASDRPNRHRISVVIPTRVGWPGMRRSVDAVLPQLARNDGEMIVVDASGRKPPELAELPGVAWISLPRTPSYELRRAGYARARAPVIAVTEDHCAPASDWLASILSEHARAPAAAVIFGLVDNGSRRHLVDWALFSVGYLAFAPPSPAQRGTPGHANISFKTWIFTAMPPRGDQILEFRYVAALRDAGYQVVATDQTLVTHYQSAGLRETATLLFHNGRSIAGLRRSHVTALDWLRALAPAWLAGFRTLRTLQVARTKPHITTRVVASLPLVALLHLAHTIGEGVGYLGGPGGSGLRLH